MSEYYESLLTGGKPGKRVVVNIDSLSDLIDLGLSSVKIAKVLHISYPTVNSKVKQLLPNKLDKLKINGKLHQIRRSAVCQMK